mmetsp:Transcript_19201/g.50915  ORF Transcript_19201/g.50915 Transcript_19201/m.50915 type:complete len:578 (+) Transcript_19201:78-1811(+)
MAAPVQISTEWWMAMAENGMPYFHNTTTKETSWIAPMISAEATIATATTNYDQATKDAESASIMTTAAQHAGLSSGLGQSHQQQSAAMQMMMHAAPPTSKNEITATGNGYIPAPWVRFEDVKIDPALLQPMLKAGFATPTAIQSYSWAIGCEGRDMIGVAKTGSGKTLGFLLPAFARILRERMSGGILMLVMAPTRELAVQIDQDAKKFLGHAGVQTALAYGGAPKRDQLADIRRGAQLLTATPGRLNDFLESRTVSLDRCGYVCMDEADRMLDMGFEPQVRKILACCPRQRQTYMFTATWPKEVRNLAADFMRDPVEIRVGDADALQANTAIDQKVQICRDAREKEDSLIRLVRGCPDQVIVFVATKRMCEQLANSIRRAGARVESIHGDRDQQSRDRALGSFKAGESKVLVATDVAGRGLDVKTIRLVVNFDPANNAEDYVHRIGRTGRANDKGDAYTFLMSTGNSREAANIRGIMEKAGQPVPQALKDAEGEKGGSSSWGKEDSWDKKENSWDTKEDKWWEKKDDGDKATQDDGDKVTPGSLIDSLLGGKRPADDEAEDAPPEKAARTQEEGSS